MSRILYKALRILIVVLLTSFAGRAFAQAPPLGSQLPQLDRSFASPSGSSSMLSSVLGESATVLVFWSNQCAWTDRYADRLNAVISDFGGRGVSFVLVNANDPAAYPQESAEESRQHAAAFNASYIMDEGSELARALGAERTPHFYVFDGSNSLAYMGTFDDSPSDAGNAQRRYLSDALEAVLAGGPVDVAQTRAYGCSIRFQ